MHKRIDKFNYYLNIAEVVASRSSCIRRHYGAVLVKDDRIVSTGYNGSPRGYLNCCDIGECNRNINNCAKGEGYSLCSAVHAEQNALLNVSRNDTIGSTIYIVGIEHNTNEYADPHPCHICKRFIQNAGVHKVVMRDIDGSVLITHPSEL